MTPFVQRCRIAAAATAIAVQGVVAAPKLLATQTPAVPPKAATGVSYHRVGATEFVPSSSDDRYSRPSGRLYAIEGSGVFEAALDLPSGAVLLSLRFDYCDASTIDTHLRLALYGCDELGTCSSLLGQLQSESNPAKPCASKTLDLSPLAYVVTGARPGIYLQATFGTRDATNQLSGVVLGYGAARQVVVGGTTVRQGESDTAYRSPMVIETPIPAAVLDPALKETRDWVSLPWSSVYTCDGIWLTSLMLKLKEINNQGTPTALITVKGTFANPHGHDKSVILDLELYSGTASIGRFRIGPAKVEETDSKKKEGSVGIPRALLIGHPMMRITMTVVDG